MIWGQKAGEKPVAGRRWAWPLQRLSRIDRVEQRAEELDRSIGRGRDQGISSLAAAAAAHAATRYATSCSAGAHGVRSARARETGRGYPFPRASRRTPAPRTGRTCWDLARWRPHYSTGSPVPSPMLESLVLLLDSWTAAAAAFPRRARGMQPEPPGTGSPPRWTRTGWGWTMRPCLSSLPRRLQPSASPAAMDGMGWDHGIDRAVAVGDWRATASPQRQRRWGARDAGPDKLRGTAAGNSNPTP